jgi:hypothetical protein
MNSSHIGFVVVSTLGRVKCHPDRRCGRWKRNGAAYHYAISASLPHLSAARVLETPYQDLHFVRLSYRSGTSLLNTLKYRDG